MGRIPLVNNRTLNIEEIIAIHDKSKKSFSKFTGFKPGRLIFGEFKVKKELPEFTNIEGTNFSRFIFDGYLSTKKTSLEILTRILEFGREHFFDGYFHVSCSFEEKNGMKKKNGHETVYVGFEYGTTTITYFPGDSNVFWDREYTKEYFQKLIIVASLPIRLYEKDKEYFLEHAKGHNLSSLQANYGGGNPYDFKCEIRDATNEELINTMNLIAKENSSDKPFIYYWSLSTSKELSNKEVYDIYELIRNAELYTDKYEVNYTCSIEELSGIETLRTFLGKKGEILMSLCSFLMSPPMIPEDEQDWSDLKVITKKEGYQIEANMRVGREKNIQKIQDKLGLELEYKV